MNEKIARSANPLYTGGKSCNKIKNKNWKHLIFQLILIIITLNRISAASTHWKLIAESDIYLEIYGVFLNVLELTGVVRGGGGLYTVVSISENFIC